MMIRTQNRPQPNIPLINLVPEIERLREIGPTQFYEQKLGRFWRQIKVLDKCCIGIRDEINGDEEEDTRKWCIGNIGF